MTVSNSLRSMPTLPGNLNLIRPKVPRQVMRQFTTGCGVQNLAPGPGLMVHIYNFKLGCGSGSGFFNLSDPDQRKIGLLFRTLLSLDSNIF